MIVIPFYVILGISAFLISLIGTRLTIMAFRRKRLMFDHPNLRSNHKIPTPKGGGIAVVMGLIICLLVADINYAIVLAILILAAVSLLDDIISVPPWVRLLVQIMAVIVALGTFHKAILFGELLPRWLDHTIVALLWIWFTNLFNFMDGIDGLSATEMTSIGGGLCLLTVFAGTFPNALSLYSLIVAAAGVGFIWWNWHPAKIFLGDVGSIPIGFLVGYLLILAITSGYWVAAAILPAYYIADGTITLIRRIYHKKKIWEAHSEHYYQRAVRRGRRHSSVVRYVAGANILLVFLAVHSSIEPELNPFHISMAYLCVFMLLGFFAHTGPNPETEL